MFPREKILKGLYAASVNTDRLKDKTFSKEIKHRTVQDVWLLPKEDNLRATVLSVLLPSVSTNAELLNRDNFWHSSDEFELFVRFYLSDENGSPLENLEFINLEEFEKQEGLPHLVLEELKN